MRRVQRLVRLHAADASQGAALVERVLAGLQEKGLLDDRLYAEARARSLHAQGASRRGIQARLRRDGIGAELVAPALESLAQDGADPDLAAGVAFARRRRLGPFRATADRRERRAQDLASLGRAGFSFETARTIVDAESEAALIEGAGIYPHGRFP